MFFFSSQGQFHKRFLGRKIAIYSRFLSFKTLEFSLFCGGLSYFLNLFLFLFLFNFPFFVRFGLMLQRMFPLISHKSRLFFLTGYFILHYFSFLFSIPKKKLFSIFPSKKIREKILNKEILPQFPTGNLGVCMGNPLFFLQREVKTNIGNELAKALDKEGIYLEVEKMVCVDLFYLLFF